MGVLIGDEKQSIFPSFFVASCDEIFDRLKNKFYEKRFNLLSRVPAMGKNSAPARAKINDGNLLLDARIHRGTICRRLLLLDVKKSRYANADSFRFLT